MVTPTTPARPWPWPANWSCRARGPCGRDLLPKTGVSFREMLRQRSLLLRRGSGHHAGASPRRSLRRSRSPWPARCWTIRGSAGSRSPTIRAADRCCRPTGWPESSPASGAQVVVPSDLQGHQSQRTGSGRLALCLGGFSNILAITGDYPTTGFGGPAGRSSISTRVGLIALLAEHERRPGRARAPRQRRRPCPRPISSSAAVVSPFKRHERELMPQYFKLLRKTRRRGPVGHSAVGLRHAEVPRDQADAGFARHGRGADHRQRLPAEPRAWPGCSTAASWPAAWSATNCSSSARSTPPGPTRGRSSFTNWPPSNWPSSRGWASPPATWAESPSRKPSARSSTWPRATAPTTGGSSSREIQFSQPDEFFLFEHDPQTGLSEPTRINPQYRRSLAEPPKSKEVTLNYRLSRLVHGWPSRRDRGCYGLMQRLFARWDKKPGVLGRLAYGWSGRRSGCCTAARTAAIAACRTAPIFAPATSCSKCGRNGPCGGSANGRCELDDKECFWARVYERLKSYGESETMLDGPLVIYNAQLKHTSSWANFYLDRDHSAGREAAACRRPGGRRSSRVGRAERSPTITLDFPGVTPWPFQR